MPDTIIIPFQPPLPQVLLTIEGNVREGKDLTDAIRASYQLVGHLSRVNPTGLSGRVAFFSWAPTFSTHN